MCVTKFYSLGVRVLPAVILGGHARPARLGQGEQCLGDSGMAMQQEVANHLDVSHRQVRELGAQPILPQPTSRGGYDWSDPLATDADPAAAGSAWIRGTP